MRFGPVTLAAVVLILAGRGTMETAAISADGQPPEPALVVSGAEAEVRGPAAGHLSVEAHVPGLLRTTGPTAAPVTFTNTGARDLSLPAWPYFLEIARASEGAGQLGFAGICARAWQSDGARVEQDPCSAAEPVAAVPAATTYTLQMRLYPRVEDGRVRPGRYATSLPLGAGSVLEVTYEVGVHDPASLPPWPPADAQLTIRLEEIWLHNPHRDEADLEIVIEDGYGRALARRDVADIVAEAEDGEVPAWTLDAPAGVWRTTILSHTDAGTQRCASPTLVLAATAEKTTTAILDVDERGQC